MTIDIRPVPADQLRRYIDTVNAAFGEPTDEAQFKLDKALLDPARVLGAYDGESLVGGRAGATTKGTPEGAARSSCRLHWRTSEGGSGAVAPSGRAQITGHRH